MVNDTSLLEDSDLNVNEVASKINYWTNIEVLYLGASNQATVTRFRTLKKDLINLYTAILEFEVEVFHCYDHGTLGKALSEESPDRF